MPAPKHHSCDDLPEAVSQVDTSAQKYLVLAHPVHHDTQKEVAYRETGFNTVTRRRKWMRWPFLVIYGLLIAIIAGAIGSVIGRAIVSNPQDHSTPNTTCPNPAPAPDTPSTNISTTDPAARVLPIQKTGCPSFTLQQYMPSTSTNSRIQYVHNGMRHALD
jgi:hypothetical protein